MPKKSVREMNLFQRLNNSLGAKTLRAIIVFAVLLGVAAITFGYYLYSNAVSREYRSEAWNLARTSAVVLNEDEIRIVSKRILEVYDSLPEASSLEAWDDSLTENYSDAADYLFVHVKEQLEDIKERSGASAVYIGTLDEERNRLIYLVDADEEELFCPPGKWDQISEAEVSTYINGAPLSKIDQIFGSVDPTPAAITTTEEYGYLCTAASPILEVNDYKIMIFCDLDMNHVSDISRRFLIQYIVMFAVVAIVFAILITRYLKKIVVKPVNKLAEAAKAYTGDRKADERRGGYFANVGIHTGDEIEALSLTMKDMEADMGVYIRNLTEVTAEKERINTELDVASKIQEGMIPHIFPAFPERPEFDIYASMIPAKEVGGDFYDYFLIDDDHLAMVMADVSGKGIPAALFMMASKIMINNYSLMNKISPAQILERVNKQICSNNDVEMFVTVWLGIFEISTGTLKAANAGHEYPAIKRRGGEFELYKDKHGFVVGGMDGVKYKEYELKFEKGDMLFQYTDGVTEATDTEGKLFGARRMIEALNSEKDADPVRVLGNVRNAVDDFAKDAEPFDDITMMCFKYIGIAE